MTCNSELDSSFGLPRIDEDQMQESNANMTTFNSKKLLNQINDKNPKQGRLVNLNS